MVRANGKGLVPVGVPIVDQDLAAYQDKKRGFADYQDIASLTSNQRIREFLFNKQDFGLKLNLGFPSHYSYFQSIVNFDRSNRIQLILFYTDELDLCVNRAKVRYLSGGHEVKPEVIKEMYENTFPLFEQNKTFFHQVRLIDVNYDGLSEVIANSDLLPAWVVLHHLQAYLS